MPYSRLTCLKVTPDGDIVMVVVGSEVGSEHPQAFLIHKHLLALHSNYFSNLFCQFHERTKIKVPGLSEGSDNGSESEPATNSVEDKD